jgi:cytochrome c553
MALLFKGLKIGGTAAFAIITAYQLFTATPKQRPRVLAGAAGGLAGGALSTYLICNLLLDIETAGWGLLICGFFAGGAGAYAGAKATEAAYDEATATDLDKAYHDLAGKRQNEIGIFNFLVNKMGSDGCIDAAFIRGFMSAFPEWANDAETVLLAAQLADAAIQRVPPAKTLQSRSFPAPSNADRETVCPACHGRSLKELVPPTMTPAELKALKDVPTCSGVTGQALDALRSAVKNLPPRPRDLVHVPYQPPPKAPGPNEHATTPGYKPPDFGSRAFPTEQEQIGTVCPNCHAPTEGKKLWKGLGPGFGSELGGHLTDADYKRLMEWTAGAQAK